MGTDINSHPILAVDIGGTKIEVGAVSREGEILDRERSAVPDGSDPEELFGVLSDLCWTIISRARVLPDTCGVGCAGPMTRGGELVSPLNLPAWRSFPLKAQLATLTGIAVYVDNDAKALALGEGWVGAAKGVGNFMAMVVSTGVGGGIVLDGRLLDGNSGNAGHIGHIMVEPGGRPCICGAVGCLEAEASGSAIAAITDSAAVEADDATIVRCGTLVGRAIGTVVTLLDLELCVVAGSVALGYGAQFFDAAQAELDARAQLEFARGARVIPAGLGSDGPLVGAAAVAVAQSSMLSLTYPA
jgi:glucokinase